MKKTIYILIFLFLQKINLFCVPSYYCTAADEKFFPLLENLVGSIHKNDPNLEEIAVYNLGFSKKQLFKLKRYKKVRVYELEVTNSKMLEPILTSNNGRRVRGAFSWKHVVLKDALEKFPYVLYLDAGLGVLNNPAKLFEHISNEGYFFISLESFHSLNLRLTDTVLKKVIEPNFPDIKEMLLDSSTTFHAAGVQGVSRSVYANYVLPLYNYSKNLEIYLDDGTAKLGYGSARHDQTLSTIMMYKNNFKKFDLGFMHLYPYDSKSYIHCCCVDPIDKETIIYINQSVMFYRGGFTKYIKKN